MLRKIILLIIWLFTTTTFAQTDWYGALRQWLTAEDMEEAYGEETMELLEEMVGARINLNQTTREELEQLPFLSAQQVEGLVEYLDRYRPIHSLSELQMVTALDYETRRLLEYFVEVREEKPKSVWPKLDNVLKYGRHTFMATAKIPFYERRGDRNGYLGYRYRHDLRYQFNYNNRIKFGLTAAQDAGEPFFSGQNSQGYDHYSYYLQLRDMGILEELNIGMYRVQMGLGLVMNTGFRLGKLATLQSMGRSTRTLTAHSSRSDAGYLQGAATTLRLSKHWSITAFASLRYIDATLNEDGTARTLITSGYHRTPTEMSKKHNTQESDFGGSIGWRKGTLYVNANTVYTHFNRPLQPQTATLYRRYANGGGVICLMAVWITAIITIAGLWLVRRL
ncbi:MAG: helix-hairpin-helix domain-containing protein [Prevotella sp.]|nr:helix-hairpin-helix domain-containing protein [Prevotella sp.]